MRKTGSMAEATRPRIRGAAARLFAEAGYDAVTMRGIGAEAGLSAGALYRYFPDKESLAAELLAEAVEERDRALDGAAKGTPIETLEGVTRAYLAWHAGSGGGAALIALMSGAHGARPRTVRSKTASRGFSRRAGKRARSGCPTRGRGRRPFSPCSTGRRGIRACPRTA